MSMVWDNMEQLLKTFSLLKKENCNNKTTSKISMLYFEITQHCSNTHPHFTDKKGTIKGRKLYETQILICNHCYCPVEQHTIGVISFDKIQINSSIPYLIKRNQIQSQVAKLFTVIFLIYLYQKKLAQRLGGCRTEVPEYKSI